jgi:uncharacterized protein
VGPVLVSPVPVSAVLVEATDDASMALERAQHFLARQPIENNIALSVLHQRIAHPLPGRYWMALRDGAVVGFALQSPLTFSAGLAPTDREAAGALATAVAGDDRVQLPGVIGEAASAATFAGRWSELTAERVVPLEGQRMYHLGVLTLPVAVPGALRRATTEDTELLVRWWQAFIADTGNGGLGDPAVAVRHDVEEGRLFVWDDDGPCCTARASIPICGVSRIGVVYTPPERRRRGYAGACVAALCSWVQQGEHAECMLYTQLANPTSNGVYRRLGFAAVAEVLQYRFEPPG